MQLARAAIFAALAFGSQPASTNELTPEAMPSGVQS